MIERVIALYNLPASAADSPELRLCCDEPTPEDVAWKFFCEWDCGLQEWFEMLEDGGN